MSVLGTKVDPEFAKKVEEYCRQNNLNPSSLIRSLLEEELAQKDKITEKGRKQFLGMMREKGLVTKIANRSEQTEPLIQGLTLEKKMLGLAILLSANVEETILTRCFVLGLARVVNLQHFKGRLNSPEAISDFALLDRAVKSSEQDFDAAEKLRSSLQEAAEREGQKK
jgi:hypothetical protein